MYITIATYAVPIIVSIYLGVISSTSIEKPLELTTEPNTAIVSVSSTPSTSKSPPKVEPIKQYAYNKVVDIFGEDNWEAFDWIVTRESSWRVGIENPDSTAKGLCQLLKPNRITYGVPDNATLEQEVDGCISYIKARYSDPNSAKSFWENKGWY